MVAHKDIFELRVRNPVPAHAYAVAPDVVNAIGLEGGREPCKGRVMPIPLLTRQRQRQIRQLRLQNLMRAPRRGSG